jgi:hypothetical protein
MSGSNIQKSEPPKFNKMKFRTSYTNRIERIQKWINDNPGVPIIEMLEEFSDTPRGTVTALLSFMLRAGHVVRGRKGYYSLPELIASPKSVAMDILKQKKAPNLFNHAKKRKWGSTPQIAPIENKQVKSKNTNTSLFCEPYTPFKTQESIERCRRISEAIDVLKSYGIKVTLEF